jgi:Ca2+-binding RTX toxin-like protein
MLTGGGGSDSFVFNFAPWSAGHITDFTPGTDKIDVSAVLSSYGYSGPNPIADGWLILTSDGAGDTQVRVNPHDPSWPWTYLITTVDHVAPTSLSPADFGNGAASTSGGTTTTGGTGSTGGTTTGGTSGGTTTGGGTTSSQPVSDSASTFTVPAGVTNVVLTGTSAQTITANNLGDTITSNDHGSTLIGGTGNDTLIAGHGPDMLTGGGGSDSFVFNFAPWSAGHITDFTPGTDKINVSGVLSAYGYSGTNPVADGWLSFVSDGAGNTQVRVNPHDPSWPWTYLITTLDHVGPSAITSQDWIFHA